MRKIAVLVFVIAIVGGTTVAITGCGKGDEGAVEQKVEQPAQEYACSMKCEGEKTYPSPGDCPVCGMSLKRVK
jgi:hypothetical protein